MRLAQATLAHHNQPRKGGRGMLARTPHLFLAYRVPLQLCSRVPQVKCLTRSIAYTRSKKFPLEGSYYDPVLRQHELLEEHLSPKFYPGDTELDEEFRKCEDTEKPFLLKGRLDLLTNYQDSRPRKWVEGVVPPRGTHLFSSLFHNNLFQIQHTCANIFF